MPGDRAHAGGGGRPAGVTLRISASSKLIGYTTIAGLSLLLAILLRRPEPAAIGVAFMSAVVLGVSRARAPDLRIEARLDRQQAIEQDEVSIDLDVGSASAVPWLQFLVALPAGLEPRAPATVPRIQLSPAEKRQLSIPLVARRWGLLPIASVIVAAHDQLGFFAFESRLRVDLMLRVFPREDRIIQAIRPLETQVFAGDEVSRRKGDGIEFADVRPFEPGDRVRRINWQVSTRLAKLHVNDLHPERNADAVIFLDTFSEIGGDRESTLLTAVRATASVARHYLGRRDRVGLVSFGGTLRWQLPAMGVTQGYKILEALLSTDSMLSYAWKGIDVIPPGTMPPKALVVAITPLMDERSIKALFDLRGRGFDLVIVEVSPVAFLPKPRDEDEELARRIWLLKREALRHEYWRSGVPVTTWAADEPLGAALQEVARFRQFAQTSRVS
jgi:uncharacterized protein (DUF58 family)